MGGHNNDEWGAFFDEKKAAKQVNVNDEGKKRDFVEAKGPLCQVLVLHLKRQTSIPSPQNKRITPQ